MQAGISGRRQTLRWYQRMVRFPRRILWQAYYRFEKDYGWMIAGHIAYMGLFAIFPFLIFLLALAGFVGQGEAADTSIQLAFELLPAEVAASLRPAVQEVRNAPHAGLITTGILLTLWAASSGLEALRHVLNVAFEVADRPAFWRTRLESLLLIILTAAIVLSAMVLLVIIPLALDTVGFLLKQPSFEPATYTGAREAAGFLLLFGLLVLLYRILPNTPLTVWEVLPGAIVSWLLWLVAVWAYTIYLSRAPSFSITYGSLGGIVLTLFFFYISALLFIFGAEVNSVLKRRRDSRRAT